jgi:hypothetical protein
MKHSFLTFVLACLIFILFSSMAETPLPHVSLFDFGLSLWWFGNGKNASSTQRSFTP